MEITKPILRGLKLSFRLLLLSVIIYASYSHGKSVGRVNQPFIKEVWKFSGQLDQIKMGEIRCAMIHDVVRSYLKKGMSYNEVEELLGKPLATSKVKADGFYPHGSVREDVFAVTWCLGTQFMKMDPDVLSVVFDESNLVIDFGIRGT